MKKLSRENLNIKALPEKVLFFGEGNFLRAFAAFIIQRLNQNCGYNGGITLLQGTEKGMTEQINAQDGLYTVIERGMEQGKAVERFSLITCVNRCLNPYEDYKGYLKIAKNPELEVIFSNTTEFGICYSAEENFKSPVKKNFPAKLTDFLYTRFKAFDGDADKGLIIIPCELIDDNGVKLKEMVLRYAREWDLGVDFISWLCAANTFASTLVDRIVSGYPAAEADAICGKLGYEDNLLDVCEPFLFFAVEADGARLEKLPLNRTGLDIVVQPDINPYRVRKVRILNGAHTMSVLAGYLSGFETVEQLICDARYGKLIERAIFEEIIPSLDIADTQGFAHDVIQRFKNPYLNHKLISISLNSISKFKNRVLPSILAYAAKFGSPPRILSFSLAALVAFYKKGLYSFVNDEGQFIKQLSEVFELPKSEHIRAVLSIDSFWGRDLSALPGLRDAVDRYYSSIESRGIGHTLEEVLNG